MTQPELETNDELDLGSDEPTENLPPWIARVFAWIWAAITQSKLGLGVFVLLIYVGPYGLGIAAVVTQTRAGGELIALGVAALVASTFVSAQPAPTPLMGTLSMVLAGFMGASFDPLVVGLVAGVVGTLGLVTSYGIGAAGISRLLIRRIQDRPNAMSAVTRAFAAIRRRGAWAVLVLAFIPNPLYAWSSVAAGVSRTPFFGYLLAASTGSIARFVVIAYIGTGIDRLVR